MKLRGIEVSKTVRRLFYRIGFAEIAWKALSVLSLTLSCIWHVGRDVNRSHNLRIVRGFGDYGPTIAVSDNNARSVLLSDHALRRNYVFLDDVAEVIARVVERDVAGTHLCAHPDSPRLSDVAEAAFKAFARALRVAVSIDPDETGVPSTKGTLSG